MNLLEQRDFYTRETLEESLTILERIVSRRRAPDIIIGYIDARKETYERIVDEICSKLNIPADKKLHADCGAEDDDIYYALLQWKQQNSVTAEDLVLMTARGLENVSIDFHNRDQATIQTTRAGQFLPGKTLLAYHFEAGSNEAQNQNIRSRMCSLMLGEFVWRYE